MRAKPERGDDSRRTLTKATERSSYEWRPYLGNKNKAAAKCSVQQPWHSPLGHNKARMYASGSFPHSGYGPTTKIEKYKLQLPTYKCTHALRIAVSQSKCRPTPKGTAPSHSRQCSRGVLLTLSEIHNRGINPIPKIPMYYTQGIITEQTLLLNKVVARTG